MKTVIFNINLSGVNPICAKLDLEFNKLSTPIQWRV